MFVINNQEDLFNFLKNKPSKQECLDMIKHIESMSDGFNDEQMAIKIFINSIYGAMAEKNFAAYNVKIAESVTLQGQELIIYSKDLLNEYFNVVFPTLHEIHKEMGITTVESPNKNLEIFMHTDSCYVGLYDAYRNTDYKGTELDFVIDIYEKHLAKWLDDKFIEYSRDRYGLKNLQEFELEMIGHGGFWQASGKYALDYALKATSVIKDGKDRYKIDGIKYPYYTKWKVTGLSIISKSSPSWARPKLKSMLKDFFPYEEDFNLLVFVKKLRLLKEEMKLVDIEKIGMTFKMNHYEKYVISDKTDITLGFQTPHHVRASAYYNHLIQQDTALLSKYPLIKSGDKVKIYYCKESIEGMKEFAYPHGYFPHEVAPELDIDTHFHKIITSNINKFLKAMAMSELKESLKVSTRFNY